MTEGILGFQGLIGAADEPMSDIKVSSDHVVLIC